MTQNYNMKKVIAIAFAALSATSIQAQENYSGYFTYGNVYRHELNPAFDNEKSYIAMPVLGNINVFEGGSLALSSILYNRNGRTVTYMNKDVSKQEFLNNIKENNRLSEDLKLQLLGWGFKAFNGYNTVSINLRQGLAVNIPGAMLEMTKEGLTNKTYEFKDLNGHLDSYAEISLGHSHAINEHWRVGGKLKVLLGIANIDANFSNVTMDLGETNYTVSADAQVNSNVKSVEYKYAVNDNGKKYVDGVAKVKPGLSGFGLAVDLGAEYTLNENWDFSLALKDLGFISYGKTFSLRSDPNNKFTTDKYLFNVDKNASNNFDDEFERLGNDFAELYELDDLGDTGRRTNTLGATLNVGVEYSCPFYKQLSFGLLNTTRLQGKYTWTDFRLSANVAPLRSISAGINYAVGTYGNSFGWVFNYHSRGLGFFLSMDHTMGKLSKQLLPLSSNIQASFGVNICY